MTRPITGETWGDEVDGVRAYLLAEAELPLARLRLKLAAARGALLAELDGVSDAQAELRPAGGEDEDAWGIAEALRHVASIESIMAQRVRLLGLGLPVDVQATYAGYMEGVDTRRLPALIEALAASYDALLAAVAAIEGDERLDTFEPHRRFGPLNCRAWLAMHTLHLQDHARQIARLKSLPAYRTAVDDSSAF